MVYLNLKYLLEKNNRSKYWLVKTINSNYDTVNKLVKNETTKISFDVINRLSDEFDCDMNTLFIKDDK